MPKVRRSAKIRISRISLAELVDQQGRDGSPISHGEPVVYVVGYAEYVKIGFTRNHHDRFRMIQTHAPERIICYALFHATRDIEKKLHTRFRRYRLQGEWFRRAGLLDSWIRHMEREDAEAA